MSFITNYEQPYILHINVSFKTVHVPTEFDIKLYNNPENLVLKQ